VKRPIDPAVVESVARCSERTASWRTSPDGGVLFSYDAPGSRWKLVERVGDAATAVRVLDVALTSLGIPWPKPTGVSRTSRRLFSIGRSK
jgi:hypothetical protein